jgi:hypothetical protein
MWRVNVTLIQVPLRFVGGRMLDTQSRLEVLLMKSAELGLVSVSTLKWPHSSIGMSESTFRNGGSTWRLWMYDVNAWYSRESMSQDAVPRWTYANPSMYLKFNWSMETVISARHTSPKDRTHATSFWSVTFKGLQVIHDGTCLQTATPPAAFVVEVLRVLMPVTHSKSKGLILLGDDDHHDHDIR